MTKTVKYSIIVAIYGLATAYRKAVKMKKEKEVKQEEVKTEEVKKTTTAFYPDVKFNRKERNKTVMLSVLLIVLMGGMGLSIILGGKNGGGTMAFISGALTLVCLIFAVSMIPSAFKQYPVKNEPLVEVKPREIVINGTPVKINEIYQVRLTLTVDPVGKKEDNLKMLQSLADKEPPKNTTGNLDFAVKDPKSDKPKTLYTTIADSYEGLLAVFSAGVKHYDIVYTMKKQSIKSTYDLNSSLTADGTKLSELSKKERLKQLF